MNETVSRAMATQALPQQFGRSLTSAEFGVAYAQARTVLDTPWPAKVRPIVGQAARTCALLRFLRDLPQFALPASAVTEPLAEALAEGDAGWHYRGTALAQAVLLLDETDGTMGSGNSAKSLRKLLNRGARSGLRAETVLPKHRASVLDEIWTRHSPVPIEALRRRRILTAPSHWVAVRDAEGTLVTLGTVLLSDGVTARWEFSVSLPDHGLRKEARFLAHHTVTQQLRESGVRYLLTDSVLHLNEGMLNYLRSFHYLVCSVRIARRCRTR